MSQILIAHRGNHDGPDPSTENTIEKIDFVINDLKLAVEIDLWVYKNEIYLGHDEPQYPINKNHRIFFIHSPAMWVHAKNLDALHLMLKQGHNVFWHEDDEFTVTSHGFIWANVGKPGNDRTIAVMPEYSENSINLEQYLGVCSDSPFNYLV